MTTQLDIEMPSIPGLSTRGFRGEVDFPLMVEVIASTKEADRLEWTLSVEETARNYRDLVNSDPARDMLFVEVAGHLVGYGRVSWQYTAEGWLLLDHFAHLRPEWRREGLRQAMARWSEARLLQVADELAATDSRPRTATYFEAFASDTERHWQAVLEELGYAPARYGFEMARPLGEPIPDLPLPPGVEVRPVGPEHYRQIWEAMSEAFRDHWGYNEDEFGEAGFRHYAQDPLNRPEWWQIAWCGGEVVGTVHNYLNQAENDEYGRRRGYTEGICVRRPWRRQGVARALIARSLRLWRDLGMDEAALGVDADNPNGALRLYQGMGYREVKRHITYRKRVGSL